MKIVYQYILYIIFILNANFLYANESYIFLKEKNDIFTKNEIKYIIKKNTLNIYIKKDWPPYDRYEFPNIIGYLKRYMTIISNKLGWKVKFYYHNNKNIDVICALKKTKKREKKYLFSEKSVYEINLGIIYPKDIKKEFSLKDLSHKRVAIIQGCSYIDYIRKKYPDIKLIECMSNLDVLRFILRKKADVGVGNYFVMDYLIEKNFLSGLYVKLIKNRDIKNIPNYLAFKKDNKILKNIIDKTITNLIDREKLYLLKRKWLKYLYKKRIYLTKKEKKFLKNHTVKIITTTSWLPFNAKDKNAQIIGIGVDYWKLIANKAHIKYKFYEAKDFSQVLESIKDKKFDINIATSKTLDKEDFSIFSKTYEKFPIAIATLKSNHFIINGAGLDGKRVAVGKSYSSYFLLKNTYPNIDFVIVQNTKEALQLVKDKKVFAAIDIEPALRYQIIYNDFKDIDITGITGVDFNLQVMIREDYEVLKSIIDKAINNITNKERRDIYKKWMGLHQKNSIDYTLIWQISIFFLIILFIIITEYLRQKKLKNRIQTLNEELHKKIQIALEKQKKDQFVLIQQSRLAQMGEAISMIAHQWRQPLNSLSILNGSIVQKFKNNTLDEKSMINFEIKSKKIIKQMSEIIDDFRNFFKPERKRETFTIYEIIKESIDIIKPILKEHRIKILLNIDKNIKIYGYKNEFGQAILNIINNSKDAFLEKNIKNAQITINQSAKNGKIMLTIEDNAGGIDKEILPKVFDPYFTTKDKRGDGIGLYMTKLIIEKHMDGNIKIENIKNGIKITIIIGEAKDENKTDK